MITEGGGKEIHGSENAYYRIIKGARGQKMDILYL